MGRNKHRDAILLGGFEQRIDMLHRVVLGDALADNAPGHAVRAEEVVLGVGDDQSRRFRIDRLCQDSALYGLIVRIVLIFGHQVVWMIGFVFRFSFLSDRAMHSSIHAMLSGLQD